LKTIIREVKEQGKLIGLVPTMGCLHQGHLSLLEAAREECDFTVMSIFVNPIQFGHGEDYEEYPRDLERDSRLAGAYGCDVIFSPPVKEMYPPGYSTFVHVEGLTAGLCGASRPGHFRGVTTVVTKLFNLVRPGRAYFGQKDAQQALVLKKMAGDLNMNLEIVILPVVREEDGLAMSSRNSYLSPEQRKQAAVIYKSLQAAEKMILSGVIDGEEIKKAVEAVISGADLARIDYVEIVETGELQPLSVLEGQCLIAVAVKFGATRLIDNIIVEV